MPTEEQLLNIIFDDGSSPNEKTHAVEALKKTTGKDRAGLVEKYTSAGPSSSFGDGIWQMAAKAKDATIEVLLRQNQDLERQLARERANSSMGREFEDLARLLVTTMRDAWWLDWKVRRELEECINQKSTHPDDRLKMLRLLIDGHLREAIVKANGEDDFQKTFLDATLSAENKYARAHGLSIEKVCASYDIEFFAPTSRQERIVMAKCPICRGMLFVHTKYQVWICNQCCDRNRKSFNDVLDLVRHISGCDHYEAYWWLIGSGAQPPSKTKKSAPRRRSHNQGAKKPNGLSEPSPPA